MLIQPARVFKEALIAPTPGSACRIYVNPVRVRQLAGNDGTRNRSTDCHEVICNRSNAPRSFRLRIQTSKLLII
jgi:hypothetical protein